MRPIHSSQRVAVIADSQNLYHTAHTLYSRNVDYTELLAASVEDRELIRAIAYVIRADSPAEEEFFDALREIGFEAKIKDIKTFADGSQKANWDLGMCLDAVTLAPRIDTFVLCSGDGDFADLCTHLRHEGVRTEVIGFGSSMADELVDAADSVIDMSEDEDRFLL